MFPCCRCRLPRRSASSPSASLGWTMPATCRCGRRAWLGVRLGGGAVQTANGSKSTAMLSPRGARRVAVGQRGATELACEPKVVCDRASRSSRACPFPALADQPRLARAVQLRDRPLQGAPHPLPCRRRRGRRAWLACRRPSPPPLECIRQPLEWRQGSLRGEQIQHRPDGLPGQGSGCGLTVKKSMGACSPPAALRTLAAGRAALPPHRQRVHPQVPGL